MTDPASGKPFTERERATLAAICDGLLRREGDPLDIPSAMADAFALLPPAQLAEVRLLLRVMDSVPAGLLFAGSARGIVSMTTFDRECMLRRMSMSAVPQMRSGFQALKRLASFLLYSMTDAAGANPTWAEIGYRPSRLAAPNAPRIRVTTLAAPATLECDVCVVGSGAGGGVAAATLAQRGKRVIVLEAGPPHQAGDFQQRELEGIQDLYLDSGLTATRDAGLAILAGSCVGGGTAVNWQTSLRTPDDVRAEWAERSGNAALASREFDDALDAVMTRTAVSTDESMVNANNAPLEQGCQALGYRTTHIPRNSRGCDLDECGYCTFGCRVGGKQSTTVTYLHDAQQHGDTEVIAWCRAHEVTHVNGRVAGVRAVARNAGGEEFGVDVRASCVVLAAGGMRTPALLIKSGVRLPQLGRNLFLHPTSAVAGRYARRIESWMGPPQTVLCDEFGDMGDGYGFRLEAAPVHPGLLALATPWTSAAAHRDAMRGAGHTSAFIVLSRDRDGGRIGVARSGHATISYTPGIQERAVIRRGIATAVRVHVAAGAVEVLTVHTRGLSLKLTPRTTADDVDRFCDLVSREAVHANWSTLFSAHQMGTCRMGRDQRSAVCDARGEVFGVRGLYVADASLFPTSSGVNPMISVMALARMVAAGIE